MRKRGYSPGFAAGIIAAGGTLGILLPPSITMILYAVAAEQSLGRLFLAAIGPALLLVALFAGYATWKFRREYRHAHRLHAETGAQSALLAEDLLTMRDKFALLPRVLPFVILLTGVMIALYGGYATPSETAGLGAVLALALIAVIYSVWTPRDLEPILVATLRESTMLMLIIGMSLLYSYVMSYLHISQSTAQSIVELHLSRWVLLATILLFVVVLGFFLPPVSIIVMTAPIILPPLKAAGFDLIWFGVVMTIVMEMGLIHPPVGLNIFVIKNIAPDIPLRDVIWGVMPFVALMMFAVVLMCFVSRDRDLVPGRGHGRQDQVGALRFPDLAQDFRAVLAQARRRPLGRHALPVDRDRRAHARNGAALGRVASADRAACRDGPPADREDVGEIVDRARRHVHGLEPGQDVGAVEPRRQAAEMRNQLGAVHHPVGIGLVHRILRQARLAEHAAQLGELAVVAGRDDDVAVGDRKHLVGHDIGMRIADPLRHLAGDQEVERLVGEHADLRIDQRGVDMAAAAGLLALGERRQDADHRIDAGEDVGDRNARARRLAVRRAGQDMKPPMPCAMRS